MARLILILCLVFTFFIAGAQNTSFLKFDSLSYQAYQDRRWKDVIKAGQQALKYDFDYYYLRMRLGIAQFNQKNYFAAIRHFKNALNFNKKDPIAISYLFFSYNLLNLDAEKEKLLRKYQSELEKAEVSFSKSGFLKDAFIEGGVRQPESGLNILGASFLTVGLTHQLGGVLQVFHGYQRFRQGYEEIIESGRRRYIYKYGIYQNQYFAGGNICLSNGFNINAGFHLQQVRGAGLSFNNNAYALGVTKQLDLFRFYMNYYQIQVNEGSLSQWTGGLIFYPIGNLNLYFGADASGFSDRDELVYNFQLGTKIINLLWVQGFYTKGNIQNYLEKGGQVFFNNQDQIKDRAGFTLSIYFKGGSSIWLTGFSMKNYNEFISPVTFRQTGAILGSQIKF